MPWPLFVVVGPSVRGSRHSLSRPLSGALLVILSLLGAAALDADCIAQPSEIVEIEIDGCRPAAVALEAQAAGSAVWWLWDYMTAIASQVPGVLVRGEVTRWRRYEPPQTLGEWQPGGFGVEYFYPSLDTNFCATFESIDSALLVVDVPCCDILPPVDIACLLELSQARSPTPLERQLAAGG